MPYCTFIYSLYFGNVNGTRTQSPVVYEKKITNDDDTGRNDSRRRRKTYIYLFLGGHMKSQQRPRAIRLTRQH
jgi:hypothetical protein